MSISTPIDPRAVWPLAYLSGRLGYRVAAYGTAGPDKDVVAVDLVRGQTRVHVDWFPRTHDVMVSQDGGLVGAYGSFPELADALERL
jgi:hypothetical protein